MKAKDLVVGQTIHITGPDVCGTGTVTEKLCLDSVNFIVIQMDEQAAPVMFEDWELDSEQYKIYEIV